jgi:hypothetical protein
VLALVFTAPMAWAQYTNSYGYSFNNPISSSMNQMMWDSLNQQVLLKSMLRKKGFTDAQLNAMSKEQMIANLGGGPQAAAEVKKLPAPSASKFKPSARRLLVPELVKALTKEPEQAKVLTQLFEAGLTAYATEAGKEGLGNDIAGAMAFFLGVSMMITHDGVAPDDDGLTIVARQLQQLFDTPQLKKVSDADKQRFFELLVGMGSYLLASWQSAVETNDDAFKAQLRDAASGVIKGFLKLEPSQVQITAAGLQVTTAR